MVACVQISICTYTLLTLPSHLKCNSAYFSGRQWGVYEGTMWYPTLGLRHSSTARLRHHHEYNYKSDQTLLTVLQIITVRLKTE